MGKNKCLPYGENMLSFKEVEIMKYNYEKIFRLEYYASFNIIKHTYIILLKLIWNQKKAALWIM